MNKNQNVPVFILAGGFGTRISEESHLKPKPMIEIGGIPLLCHIMRSYYAHGFNDFVICAGYRSWEIKSYFLNYEFRQNHLVIDHRQGQVKSSPPATLGVNQGQEKWRVTVLDTGENCMTGARVARAIEHYGAGNSFSDFALTYGDGLSDVNLSDEFAFHQSHGKIGTILGVRPPARFGEIESDPGGGVRNFLEKPESHQGSINGGFFFFKRKFRDYLTTDPTSSLEREPLFRLAKDRELMMMEHHGFWQCMDTLRDRNLLEDLWASKKAPWLMDPR